MTEDQRRPARLGGFRTLLVGGPALAMLLAGLDPITQARDCPNYGGNGNASVFANPVWDDYFLFIVLGWIILVVVEQLLPVTWRDRGRSAVVLRAVSAPVLAVTVSCCGFLPVVVLCH